MAVHQLSMPDQKDHLIFVFRQSTGGSSNTFIRTNRDVYITKARLIAKTLKRINKVDIGSLAVIAKQDTKGRFMPSLVLRHKMEIREL
jgi:hypothetical protein